MSAQFRIILATVIYLLAVKILRFHRRSSLYKRGFWDRESYHAMDLQEAFKIQLPLAELEFQGHFPFLYSSRYLNPTKFHRYRVCWLQQVNCQAQRPLRSELLILLF